MGPRNGVPATLAGRRGAIRVTLARKPRKLYGDVGVFADRVVDVSPASDRLCRRQVFVADLSFTRDPMGARPRSLGCLEQKTDQILARESVDYGPNRTWLVVQVPRLSLPTMAGAHSILPGTAPTRNRFSQATHSYGRAVS